MESVLITGGAGFLGELLKKRLLDEGYYCVSVDLEPDPFVHPNLQTVRGDIRDPATMERIFSGHQFRAIFHCAAILAHEAKDTEFLWSCNVEGTRSVAEFAKRYRVPKVIYISTNCLWGQSFGAPVGEERPPMPVEVYGLSKREGEKILNEHTNDFDVVIIRCPTIIDSGRLGLLAILFEFIDEGRKVWVVGGGANRYQFIYAQDLIEACLKAVFYRGSAVFNIGSDNVKTFLEVYQYVIDKSGTNARVARLPKAPTIALMKLTHALKISPLGPYQYKMIAESFVFDTAKIKQELQWSPTLTNEEMLYKGYRYYHDNLNEIRGRTNVSSHRKPAKMGVIKLLKWMS